MCGVNAVARLLPVICTVVAFGALAAEPVVSESDEPPSQPAAATPPQNGAQSPAVAPGGPSTPKAATPDTTASGKPDTAARPGGPATSPATANAPVANKPGTKVLVDDTVTDAQLKQILKKGYHPVSQARGHEVQYCRSETELGSRFETKVCRTAAQILQDEQAGKDSTTYLNRTGASADGVRR